MKCPLRFIEDKVVDSRESREGDSIRRRRECLKCERRFTSYERIDQIPYMVTKKDQTRETFDRNKVMADSCAPVKSDQFRRRSWIVSLMPWKSTCRSPRSANGRPARFGELIMRRLKELDKVAYVRFGVRLS